MDNASAPRGLELRIRGLVQGVGFRPTVLRHARARGIVGDVANDGDAVVVRAWGDAAALAAFCDDVRTRPPPLARIDETAESVLVGPGPDTFSIVASTRGAQARAVLPDAAVCAECLAELLDPGDRRHRYPFINCTHCGPRYSIVRDLPYDRQHTAMSVFPMCANCRAEFDSPEDRRFHAQPNACPTCGPTAQLLPARPDVGAVPTGDPCDAAAELLLTGAIVAIKGLGGYHLACDATDETVVTRLRTRKRRPTKALALMARDVETIRRYAAVDATAEELLRSPAGPIVLLPATGADAVAPAVAPSSSEIGFMLPTTPLHHLVLSGIDRPVVMTSGNLAESPPCTDDVDAGRRLREIADWLLVHDRPIVNRVDDSVMRVVDGTPRCLRRARGYAPAPVRLPPGFAGSSGILAYGTQIKNTFCLLDGGEAVVSPHMGDLDDARTRADYRAQLERLRRMMRHEVRVVACDRHPDYASTALAREHARAHDLPLIAVQHHHAHVAACLADHGRDLHDPPVLGVILDGIGLGDDETLWGGEFLRADYRGYERLGTFLPVRLPGGDAANREPWRNLYAHLRARVTWSDLEAEHGDLAPIRALARRPLAVLEQMLERGLRSPLASSCGRLFDAVSAAVGLAPDRVSFEGEAAMRLEAACDPSALGSAGDEAGYPFAIARRLDGLPYVEPRDMWAALLSDLRFGVPTATMAARFHLGLATAIATMVQRLTTTHGRPDAVVLTGGVFQNAILLRLVSRILEADRHRVLIPRRFPCNDGGVSLGQATVAFAQSVS